MDVPVVKKINAKWKREASLFRKNHVEKEIGYAILEIDDKLQI